MTKNMTMIMNMKSGLVFAALALVAAGCGKNIEYDACGQVDATQVTVSAENAGRVLSMAVEEGEVVTAGQLLGALDSVQTYLQIMELRERIAGSSSRLVDIKKQGQPNLSQLETFRVSTKGTPNCWKATPPPASRWMTSRTRSPSSRRR